MSSRPFDVVVIGAGAAGMMAAAVAGQRGLRVVLIDHASRLAEKIRISGGGRCNFTNLGTTPANFISRNPHFSRSALAAYTPQDFIQLLGRHGVTWHEKHRGQLFCDDSSEEVIRVLRTECERGAVAWRMPCAVQGIQALSDGGFSLETSQGNLKAGSVVLATGGMAIPQLGATDYALQVARQFGMKIVEPRPALVPLTFDGEFWKPFSGLSGVALEVTVSTPADAGATGRGKGAKQRDPSFVEDLLFTHRGLSGPAILQISSYWNPGQPLHLNLATGQQLDDALIQAKPGNRQQLATVLAGLWPRRLADVWLQQAGDPELPMRRMADVPDRVLRELGGRIHDWVLVPGGTAGYRKAEVMRGGVDTAELDQKTLESRRVPGLYVVGEAVDVTGWLGGYNFQWAWASGAACGRAVRPFQA